uniref:Uncharacterized protein n=1 Tax=Guillardia theta TaxID=55529 RepID=A0A6U5XA30_GUITH
MAQFNMHPSQAFMGQHYGALGEGWAMHARNQGTSRSKYKCGICGQPKKGHVCQAAQSGNLRSAASSSDAGSVNADRCLESLAHCGLKAFAGENCWRNYSKEWESKIAKLMRQIPKISRMGLMIKSPMMLWKTTMMGWACLVCPRILRLFWIGTMRICQG